MANNPTKAELEKEIKKLKKIAKLEQSSVGRRTIIKTPKQLLELFEKYLEKSGFEEVKNKEDEVTRKRRLFISVSDFMNSLNLGSTYWYEIDQRKDEKMNKEFSELKKEITERIENHLFKASASGDIKETTTIFYAKNKFGFSDKVESVNLNYNRDINPLEELTDEELEAMLNEKVESNDQ